MFQALKTMRFSSSNFYGVQNINPYTNNNFQRGPAPAVPIRPASLSAPMIDRVHKTKPGCSACGKRVA